MDALELTHKIAEDFKANACGPFPQYDIASLRRLDPKNWDLLHGMLDLYCGNVAGYALGAKILHKRPTDELLSALLYLSDEFFLKYPELQRFCKGISPKQTPELFHQLRAVEEARRDLVILIRQILEEKAR